MSGYHSPHYLKLMLPLGSGYAGLSCGSGVLNSFMKTPRAHEPRPTKIATYPVTTALFFEIRSTNSLGYLLAGSGPEECMMKSFGDKTAVKPPTTIKRPTTMKRVLIFGRSLNMIWTKAGVPARILDFAVSQVGCPARY